jgi:hypothetical protein
MAVRRQPVMLKYWPVTVSVLVAFVAWELYLAHTEERPIEWVWMGLCAAGIALVFVLRWVLRE